MNRAYSAQRRHRRGCNAQAVVETALIIPIMLFLLAAFIAITVQVETEAELNAATTLAAESVFQTSHDSTDKKGTTCCNPADPGLFDTGGLPTRCRYAAETFYGTVSYYNAYLQFKTGTWCAHDSPTDGSKSAYSNDQANIQCDINYYPPGTIANGEPTVPSIVRCTSTATLLFSRTPLAWAIFWDPTITSTDDAVPPPFRQ